MRTCHKCAGALDEAADFGQFVDMVMSPKELIKGAKNNQVVSAFLYLVSGERTTPVWEKPNSVCLQCLDCKRKFVECGCCGRCHQVAGFPTYHSDYLCSKCEGVSYIG